MDDDTFASLEEISDEQTLERLESLFESTSSFPSVSIIPIPPFFYPMIRLIGAHKKTEYFSFGKITTLNDPSQV